MNSYYKKFFYFLLLPVIFLSLSFIFAINKVEAATIYASPSVKSVNIGDVFTVRFFINTQGKNINASEGTINFSNDLVSVTAINSNGSIFSLWPETPSFSNDSGRAFFNGGVPNPGYNGSGGQVVSLTFRAKSSGTAYFSLSGVAIRENDGLGTDIFSGQSGTSVIIKGVADQPEKTVETPVVPKLSSPSIYSSVYADQNSWYSKVDGVVNFHFPAGVSSIQTLIDNNPQSIPKVSYTPPIFSKTLSNLSDGVWYFHLRYKLNGEYSNTVHYKIQIDNTPPKNLSADVIMDGDIKINLTAEDELSGIEKYDVIIDNSNEVDSFLIKDLEQPIVLTGLTPGDHQIKVIAYDRAGNKTEFIKNFKVETLSVPILNSISGSLEINNKMTVAGQATPQTKIKLVVTQSNNEEVFYEGKVSESGNFMIEIGPFKNTGNYKIKAISFNDAGLISPDSATQSFVVIRKISISFPKISITWSQILSSIGWLVLISFMLYGWYKFWITRNKLIIAKKQSEQAFIMLLDRAEQQLRTLERLGKKRKMNRSESLALGELSKIIDKVREIKKEE